MLVQTWSASDDVADMWLCTDVECVEKQLELLSRLATERWQQLSVRSERRLLRRNVIYLDGSQDLLRVQLVDESWVLAVQRLQQKHVVLPYDARVWQLVVVV